MSCSIGSNKIKETIIPLNIKLIDILKNLQDLNKMSIAITIKQKVIVEEK